MVLSVVKRMRIGLLQHCSPVVVALRSRLHSSKTRTAQDVAFLVLLVTTPLQMVPIFPGETGEVNLRFAGDFLLVGADASITSGLQQRHTEQIGSPRQDALEHISRPLLHKEAPQMLVTMPMLSLTPPSKLGKG